ncbi:MAG: glycosyltransferase family 2 protein [Rhodovulum sp.]|nr:glycosyltransferase family 2 protein [Rhodovulum sp.]
MMALPRVSVVVTSYNYAGYLREAVASVRAQTYEPIECIVVDDASTDGSDAVLDTIAAEWPDIRVIRHPENRGQTAACLTGLAASRGHYVVFLDSDDALCPDFVATHVYVHLSSRMHPGLTSSDIFQVVENEVVLSTFQPFNDRVTDRQPTGKSVFRPIAPAPDGPWALAAPAPDLLESAVYVPPGQVAWCWSPGSANMYRRDAIALFADAPELTTMRLNTDAMLCMAIGHRCGSVLIDRPLSLYRLHGGNGASRQAQLANVRVISPEKEPSLQAVVDLIEIYTRESVAMVASFWSAETYLHLLERLDAHLATGGRAGVLDAAIARHHAALVAAIGPARLAAWTAARARRSRRQRWRALRRRWLRRR